MKRIYRFLFFLTTLAIIFAIFSFKDTAQVPYLPIAQAIRQPLKVDVKTVGELEAASSLIIASTIKGDLGKIIDLIPDGIYVSPGQILVKLDPTPFEEKREKLEGKIKEQESIVLSLERACAWEKCQAEHKNKTAAYEVDTAKLELDKMMHGDGPQEISRLKAAMQKAYLKFEEMNAYSNDLQELESQGILNAVELKQAQKRLEEEREAYEMTKLQHDSYVQHVYPMLVKKAETALKRAQVAEEETLKLGDYSVAKAYALLEQAKQGLADSHQQWRDVANELIETEIKAPASGMVVHREDYRNGQKRKPRVGDVLVRNQPLIDLPDLSAMVIKTRVREVDLYKVDIGKKATIEIDAYPEMAFQGTIKQIGVLAVGDTGRANDEKYFEVRMTLDESDSRLRPGMTARTTIHAQALEDRLTIPLHAIFEENKQLFCYVSIPGTGYEKKEVTLGASNDQWVEVLEGLSEGASVCLLNPFQSQR